MQNMEHLCALDSHQLKQSSRHVTQTIESGHQPSRDVTHGLYMHATHCSCWSGYRWHQQMNAILMSLLWCRLQIATAIELIEEVCQHSWLVSPTHWVTVVDWHFLTESFLPWCKKTFSCVFMVRRMNIWTDNRHSSHSLRECGLTYAHPNDKTHPYYAPSVTYRASTTMSPMHKLNSKAYIVHVCALSLRLTVDVL